MHHQSSGPNSAATTIGDLKHPCIVPTVCLTKGGPQIFKTDHHADFSRDHRLKAVDVALATSAAPSYFPIAEIDDGLYADGGLYANSPDLPSMRRNIFSTFRSTTSGS